MMYDAVFLKQNISDDAELLTTNSVGTFKVLRCRYTRFAIKNNAQLCSQDL